MLLQAHAEPAEPKKESLWFVSGLRAPGPGLILIRRRPARNQKHDEATFNHAAFHNLEQFASLPGGETQRRWVTCGEQGVAQLLLSWTPA